MRAGDAPLNPSALGQRPCILRQLSIGDRDKEEAFMKSGAVAIVLAFAAFGNDFCHPASAQSSVGGPKKQIVVGGAAKQNSPVVPVNKAASIPAAKQNSPVAPVSKGVTISASSPPPHLKCAAGSCIAKGAR
jgi:hypothetical protein